MLLDRVARPCLTTNFTRCGGTHGHQRVAVRHLGQSAAARAEALRMSRWYAPFFMIRPRFSLAIRTAVRDALALRAPQHPPAGLLAVAAEEHLLFWRRLLRCYCGGVVLRQAADGDLHSGNVDGPGLLHFWAVASMAFCVGSRRWLCTVGAGRAGRAAEIEGQLVVTH